MHIIIPMSGSGSRFLKAGYQDPKPLIQVENKPIIEHVCDLFPNESKITFICNEDHLKTTAMYSVLKKIRPSASIVAISPHKKGPVFAVSKIFDDISDSEEVIVNYCDFGTYWDYSDFLKHTRNRNADGAIAAYRGFHPHMLGTTNYAFIREKNQWLEAIQEKKPFTDNRLSEYASNGTYYFKYGRYIKHYFQQLMDLDLQTQNEFYVSMVYHLLKQDNLNISIYEIQHMLQWGTPEDLEEYLTWSNYFNQLVNVNPVTENKKLSHVNLIPMAGFGKRFSQVGYEQPKPLIEISGKPMVIQAVAALPQASQTLFVCLEEHLKNYPLSSTIKNNISNSVILSLSKVTEGQAITCEYGLSATSNQDPILIGACDNSALFNRELWSNLINDNTLDGIVFTFKNHVSVKRNPHMYGYVSVDSKGFIRDVSVKKPFTDCPADEHAIVGTFYFKNADIFYEGLAQLKAKNHRINGEFYVDSLVLELVKLGYSFKPLLVDYYICWGTPDDLKTFQYWQSFFHKVSWHPYSLEKDSYVSKEAIPSLNNQFKKFAQEYR